MLQRSTNLLKTSPCGHHVSWAASDKSKSMLLNCTDWRVVPSSCKKTTKVRETPSPARPSVKSCILFSIPTEAPRLTEQTAGRLRQMGRACWNAILHSGLIGGFWATVHFYSAIYVSVCVCVCAYMSVWYFRLGWWTRTNCSFSFTHHWTALFYSQERDYTPSLYLPSKVWYMHLSFTVFQKHTTYSVCILASAYVSSCHKVWADPNPPSSLWASQTKLKLACSCWFDKLSLCCVCVMLPPWEL